MAATAELLVTDLADRDLADRDLADRDLADREPQGWHREVETFVRSQRPALVRRAMALTRDPHEAEDVVQAVLARTLPHWHRIDSTARTAYVLRGVHNDVVSRARRNRHEVPLDDACNPPDDATRTDPALAYGGLTEQVRLAVAGLPPRQRAVVALRFLADYSVADTAELLGCSEGTVKSQSCRALASLRPALSLTLDAETA